jgi:hypothetical protein
MLEGLPASSAPTAPPPTTDSALAPDVVDASLRELGRLIAGNHFRAGKLFESTRHAFDQTPAEPQATLLALQLERLDFSGASATLRELIDARAGLSQGED